jgi:hypothetical protein
MRIPADPVDRNVRGIEAERRGAEDTAVAYYEANVRDGFDGSHPYERLAIIYRRRGEFAREVEVLEQAMRTLLGRPYSEAHVAKFSARLEKAKALASGQPLQAKRQPAPPARTNAAGERVCATEGCSKPVGSDARRYCDECREIREAPNVMRPGDHRPEKLFFPVAGTRHHLSVAAAVRPAESLYLVRERENPHDPNAVEVRRGTGELIGYVPRARELQGKFGYGPYTLADLAQAMDAGASCTAKCYAAGGNEPGSVQLEGHCSGWLVPHPARVEVWKKRGGGFNQQAEPLPFELQRLTRVAPNETAPSAIRAACAQASETGLNEVSPPTSAPVEPDVRVGKPVKLSWWRRLFGRQH